MKVNKSTEIILDNRLVLLEEGDDITINNVDDMELLIPKPNNSVDSNNFNIEQIAENVKVEKIAENVKVEKIVEKTKKIEKTEAVQQQILVEEVEKILNKSESSKSGPESELLSNPKSESSSSEMLMEAAVHRKYLEISEDGEDNRYFSPASANDNYILYFIDRLFQSKEFANEQYKCKIVKQLPLKHKNMSLETFLKALLPVK